MLIGYQGQARKANARFYRELERKERAIKNICGMPYALARKNIGLEEMERDLPKYHNRIDESKLTIIQDIEADYKRRKGNLVLKLAKFIKPEIYEKPRFGKLKPSDLRCPAVKSNLCSENSCALSERTANCWNGIFPAGCRKSRKKWRKSANGKTEKDRR